MREQWKIQPPVLGRGIIPVLILLLLGMAGCRIAPAKPAGFVNPAVMRPSPEDTAFRREYVAADYNPDRIRKIFIKPVIFTDTIKNNNMQGMSTREMIGLHRDDIKDLVDYAYTALRQAVPKNSNFQVADRPGPDTLNIELALVQVVPGKPFYKGAMLLLVFPIGTAVDSCVNLITDNSFNAQAAMECRITDASGKLVMGLADNEKNKAAILNLLNFTTYGNQRQMIDEWAQNIVKQLANIKGKSVPAPAVFVLINY
ncbi:MAG: DUF3313 family protein [Victivallales bacterium]|nr:DUF3313 family protein [Victivallales bacterium]